MLHFRVWDFGFLIPDFRSRVLEQPIPHTMFSIYGLGFRVSGEGFMQKVVDLELVARVCELVMCREGRLHRGQA